MLFLVITHVIKAVLKTTNLSLNLLKNFQHLLCASPSQRKKKWFSIFHYISGFQKTLRNTSHFYGHFIHRNHLCWILLKVLDDECPKNIENISYCYNSQVVQPIRYIKHCKPKRKDNSWYFIYPYCPAAPSEIWKLQSN